jgi:hypothetical protein
MTEATGMEAKTIHRLLDVDPRSGGFRRNETNCLDCDPLVVGEASIVDVLLGPPRANECFGEGIDPAGAPSLKASHL